MSYAQCEFDATDEAGNLLSNVSVEVRRQPGLTLEPLYSDREGASNLANPFAATDGKVKFFAAGGAFRIVLTAGSYTRTRDYVAVGRAAETDLLLTSPKGAWDSGSTYSKGDLVSVAVGTLTRLFASVQNSNTNHTPDSTTPGDTSWWMYVGTVAGTSSAPGITLTYDSTTSAADPGNGKFRLNNATHSSATALYADNVEALAGASITSVLDSWDDSTSTIRGTLKIAKASDPTVFRIYSVTAAVVDSSGYRTVFISHKASAGTLSDGDQCVLMFLPTGDKGTLGGSVSVLDPFGVAAQRTPYLGQVGTRCILPNSFASANKQLMSRRYMFARDTIDNPKIAIPNWRVNTSSSGVEQGLGADATVTASIEYPEGTFTQVLFSGSATGTIPDGTTLLSDEIPVHIPKGEKFFVRLFLQNSAGIAFQTGSVGGIMDFANGDAFRYAASGLTDQTMSGTITNTDTGGTGFTVAAVVAMTNRPSVFIAGDSLGAGTGDAFSSAPGDVGIIARSIGPGLAYINAAVPTDRAQWAATNFTKRAALAAYCSHVILQHGRNDLSGSRTSTQLLADQETLRALLGKPAFLTTITPRTTSSDSYATVAGQTTTSSTQEAQRVAYNAAVRAVPTNFDGFFDVTDELESARDSGLWNADGTAGTYTTDGLHPTRFANERLARSHVIQLGAPARTDALDGMPSGGSAGQVLVKNSALAYDTTWATRREVLTANRTYYVRTDGSDSNDGLSNTSGGAFLTIAKAIQTVAALDLSTLNAMIQLQDATWSERVSVAAPWIGSGTVTLQGNTSTPANVVIDAGSNNAVDLAGAGSRLSITGLTLKGAIGVAASNGATVTIGAAVVFGACTGAHMRANGLGASIIAQGVSYSVTGAAPIHAQASPLGYINLFSATCTLSGTLNFSSAFASADRLGFINASSATITGGTVTGKRYSVASNAVINTNGGGASFFPGDSAGTTATGGQYL